MQVADLKILLLENDSVDADFLRQVLPTPSSWQIVQANQLSQALAYLAEDYFDVILLSLCLTNQQGLTTLKTVYQAATYIPIIVLTDDADEAIAIEMLRQGAQDYLVRGQIDTNLLTRSIRYAIERAQTLRVMRRQSAAIEATGDGIAILDQDERFVYVNQAYAAIYNYASPADLLGGSWRSLYDPADLRHMAHQAAPALQSQGFWYGEVIACKQDGERFYQELSLTAIDNDGFICIIRDVTERKRVEEALQFTQFTVNHAAEAVVWTGADAKFVYVNEAACRLFGYRREELMMMTLYDLTPDLSALAWAKEWNLLKLHRSCTSESWQQHRDGHIFPVEVTKNYLEYRGQEYNCAFMRDITERKQAEIEIYNALAKEKELNQLKSSFVSMVSHEFRNPLSAIVLSSELLERYAHKSTEEQKVKYLKRIQGACDRMTELLDKILILGRAEAGKLICQAKAIALSDFCQELVDELQISSGQQYQLRFSCSGSPPTTARMDENLLRHIFGNLLSNAMKYSPPNSVVQFTLHYQDNQAIFSVQDSGIGIPPDDQARLFESFYRATNVGTISGTGLGLAIVKNCIEAHEGQIAVSSVVGEGTTFTVTLPLQPSTDTQTTLDTD